MNARAVVTARAAKRWEQGHPWIYRSGLERRPDVPAGIVEVADTRGRRLGQSLWSPASEISLRLLDRNADASIDASIDDQLPEPFVWRTFVRFEGRDVPTIRTALVMAAVSLAPPQWLAVVLLLLLGVAWIVALTTLNSTAQAILPNWVRGRGLAVYLTVFNGALTGGSLLWGLVAETVGARLALLLSAVGLIAVSYLLAKVKLPAGDADLVQSNHWPEPLTAAPVEHDRGPVMVLSTAPRPASRLKRTRRLVSEIFKRGLVPTLMSCRRSPALARTCG